MLARNLMKRPQGRMTKEARMTAVHSSRVRPTVRNTFPPMYVKAIFGWVKCNKFHIFKKNEGMGEEKGRMEEGGEW